MKVFTATTTIDASPDTLWQILTDGPHYPEWDPNVDKIEGRIAPGETIKVYSRLRPGKAFKVKVTAFVPGRKMIWSSGMPLGLFRGERSFLLEKEDDGTTRFILREEFSGLLLPLIGRALPDLTPSFEAFAGGLKDRAETGG